MATLGERLAALSDASPRLAEKRAARIVAKIEEVLSRFATERGSKMTRMSDDFARRNGISLTPLVIDTLRAQHVLAQRTVDAEGGWYVFTWPVAPS